MPPIATSVVYVSAYPPLPDKLLKWIVRIAAAFDLRLINGAPPLDIPSGIDVKMWVRIHKSEQSNFNVHFDRGGPGDVAVSSIRGPYNAKLPYVVKQVLGKVVLNKPRTNDIGSASSGDATKASSSFAVFIDPGEAPDEAIADFLEALSELHIAHGGEGLSFTSSGAGFVASEVDADV